MRINEIENIIGGEVLNSFQDEEIKSLIYDSRKPFVINGALFFAIEGAHHDGHNYIKELYSKGVRNFVVEKEVDLPQANVIKVDNAIEALQQIAAARRDAFEFPVIGITGSNGKTITKEWLYTCLSSVYRIVRSPQSFNSQLGVPLSVWSIGEEHNLGIFEAGISQVNEMENLERVIQPTIGIFTNLGGAHDEGFSSREEKLREKSLLFKNSRVVIFNGDNQNLYDTFKEKAFCWGTTKQCHLKIVNRKIADGSTYLTLTLRDRSQELMLPFTDAISVENCMHCIAVMTYMDMNFSFIQKQIDKLNSIPMRLEMKNAINHSLLIDDSYNNDLGGFKRAMEFLATQKQRSKKVVILSDILQSGKAENVLYDQVKDQINAGKVDMFIGIGPAMIRNKESFDSDMFFENVDDFLHSFDMSKLTNSVILLKGARSFAFEKISKRLEEKIHGTVLEINLDALTNNLNFYRSKMQQNTKLMVMVKAFAYGSGSHEIANLMQFHRVDYLGVAYADEGVDLRENGIYTPIMVMNPTEESYDLLLKYNLEPEIYGLEQLMKFAATLSGRTTGIHIKLETGMNRLGIEEEQIEELINVLESNSNIEVKSILSHLAGADEEEHTDYSRMQAEKFVEMSDRICKELDIQPLRHLVNSPGILRFPEYHFDMVRLGIGLYGLEANKSENQKDLQNISTLKTVVSQIREIKKGETVGYGRKGVAAEDLKIATIAVGYADGFSRSFSGGIGEVWIGGNRAPVIGNVCMDMTMIDITGLEVQEGDEVEIFGQHISIQELADKIKTIPYEILTNVSQRVKRVYYSE